MTRRAILLEVENLGLSHNVAHKVNKYGKLCVPLITTHETVVDACLPSGDCVVIDEKECETTKVEEKQPIVENVLVEETIKEQSVVTDVVEEKVTKKKKFNKNH